MPEKLYTEDQVGAIIKRAVELQEQGQAQSYTPGVTVDELERISREIGVSVEFLRRAIAEHGGNGPLQAAERPVFSKDIERIVDGELDPGDFDYIANELPTSGSPQMQPAQIGRTLKATVMAGTTTAQINVTARNGRTRVTVNAKPILTTVFGGQAALFGTIFGSAIIAAQNQPFVGIAVLVAGFTTGLSLFLGGLRASNKKAAELADSIVRSIEDRLSETTPRREIEERLAHAAPEHPVRADAQVLGDSDLELG